MIDDQIIRLLISFLGNYRKHDDDSGQISFDCPACSEEKGLPEGDGKGNLEINYKKGVFNCWACGEDNRMRGPIHYLLRRYAPKGVRDLFTKVYDKCDYAAPTAEIRKLVLPKGLVPLYDHRDSSWEYLNAKRYMTKRGITEDMARRHKLSLCTDKHYSGRIYIPSVDTDGATNYFTTRTTHDKTKTKYVNSDVDKTSIIFNEGLINTDSTIHIVEGPFDHIVVPNSIPTLGKVIYPKLYYFLQATTNIDIVVLYDGDAFKSTMRVFDELNTGNLVGRVRVIKLPNKYDPSKINEKYGSDGIRKVLSTSYKPNPVYT